MARRLAATFFALLALALLAGLFFGVMRALPGADPQTILGGYSPAQVEDFFAGLTLEQRQIWRTGIIYLDFPFIFATGMAGYLTFSGAHGPLRLAGMAALWVFVFCDALEDFQLLARLDPILLAGWLPDPAISQDAFWLGSVTTAKFVALLAVVLLAVPAIWQKPRP